MMDDDPQYLVDNNVLTKLTVQDRASAFFTARCHIPTEVLYEARDYPDYSTLAKREYRTTPSVLRHLVDVLKTVPSNDTKLLNLYANQGNADPLIIACALDGKSRNDGQLFGPTWIVVSDDGAVQSNAVKLGVPLMTSVEFRALFDSAE
ncbi:hypothetical protein [Gordonia sp. SND2]|uniref:hypothetical protein n=1 Tax=Gordonia sp. SND2 TaxID=3388659 RepID=UPI00398B555A